MNSQAKPGCDPDRTGGGGIGARHRRFPGRAEFLGHHAQSAPRPRAALRCREDLAYARAEAVKLQGNVALAAKPGGLTNGWVVFEDTDADEVLDRSERRCASRAK